MANNTFIVRFEQSNEQVIGNCKKIVGLMRAKHLINVIDNLDLGANPRESKTGDVVESIIDSIESNSLMFPYKTKGILLAVSQYETLERGRLKITPVDMSTEGIIDGGHNTLAIGLYILKKAIEGEDVKALPKKLIWSKFKEYWSEYRSYVDSYLAAVRDSDDEPENLNFLIPVELLVPRDPEDLVCSEEFRNNINEICGARNHNQELTESSIANKEGYYDVLKSLMDKRNPDLCKNISWKANDGGSIKVEDLVAMSWIPLNLLTPVVAENGKKVDAIAPSKIYSGKGSCVDQFSDFMSSPDVSKKMNGRYEVHNTEVISAFKIAVVLPELYDYISEKFPAAYNAAGGSYGRITPVKKMNVDKNGNPKKNKHAEYSDKPVDTVSPVGFIMPLLYALQPLMVKAPVKGGTELVWKQDPFEFIDDNINKLAKRYKDIIDLCVWDPQKVGKSSTSYQTLLDTVNMILAGII